MMDACQPSRRSLLKVLLSAHGPLFFHPRLLVFFDQVEKKTKIFCFLKTITRTNDFALWNQETDTQLDLGRWLCQVVR